MLDKIPRFLRSPVFPADEHKNFTASLVQAVLWTLLGGLCLYAASAFFLALIPPHMILITWLYVLALSLFTVVLMVALRRGYVQQAAVALTVGLWIILTVAAYFNGGVVAPAYSGYLIVIMCASLLLSWRWGLVSAIVSTVAGVFFLLAASNNTLPPWRSHYNEALVWVAAGVYFFIATVLLSLALRVVQRASQQMQREVAERLKTEQALSHSEQRLQAIFDSVNDAIFVQELRDGRILDVNQKMGELYGYTVEEARQLTIEELSAGYAPYTLQEAQTWWQKTAAGEPQIFEWLSKDRTGRLFWVEVNMRRAIIDGQERLLVVVRDIDDRKRAEAALRREQAYYQAIVNTTPVMLWLKDTQNRTLRLNPAAASLEGIEAAQVEGKSAYDLYPREQAEAYYQDDLEVIRSGQPKLGIIEQHTSAGTGKVMWVETGKVPVRDEQGEIVGVLACAIDITARQEAEQLQVATRQIAEATLMTSDLGEFYRSLHAILSPLIPAKNFYIALYEAATDLFHVPYLIDEFDEAWPPYSPRKGLNAYVMRTGKSLLVTWEAFAAMQQQGEVEIINRPMSEWLGVPLRTPQGLLGVMAVQNYSGPACLNHNHQGLLEFVSAQVAMAIERKRAEERDRRVNEGLRVVIAAAQELIDCADLNTLYRRSVELAREKLGLERCALYVLEDDEKFIQGTFGTDDQAQTTDERLSRESIEAHPEVFPRDQRLWMSYERRFTYWKDNGEQVLEGKGWNVATPIRSSRRTLGVLYNDTAISRAPLDETQQDLTAVYCSLLGSLLELKRTEDDLAHERDLLQALMDSFPDTIYFKDTASRFTRINWAQAHMLGVATPEAAIGKTDADFFRYGELAQEFLQEEQALMTSGAPITDRLEYNPTPDGQPRWLSASKVPLRDVDGRIVGLVGISRNISDRMLAEQREKNISQGLRTVIEAAQVLIACADLDTLYQRSVELAREKLGLERCSLHLLDEQQQYLIGTYGAAAHGQLTDERAVRVPVTERLEVFTVPDRLWSVLEKPYPHWPEAATAAASESGWLAATPIRSRRQSIGILYNDAAITQAPLDKTQQEIVAVYCSLLGSLIELKRTEDQLAHERDLLQSLMDNIPDAIYFKDTASRFTQINRAMARILGIHELHEAVGKTDTDFFADALNGMYGAEERQLLLTGQPLLDRQEYNPTSTGQPRWFSASKVPLRDVTGQIVGMVGISRDITDHMLAAQRDKTISRGLRAVIEAADELMSCTDLDALYRRAVELAREKLQVERCGLFMLDEHGWLCGTYGTDLLRQTSQEQGAHFPPVHMEGFDAASTQLWRINDTEQTYWEAGQQRVAGKGWVGTTFIRTRDRVMGVFYNDTAITRAPVDEAQQEVLAVYCSLLGSLIQLKHAEETVRESERLYRRAIEAAGAVPYYLDYTTETYRFVGNGIQHLTGLTPAEMQPAEWDTLLQQVYLLGEAAPLTFREAVRETRAGHINVWRADYYVLTRDGRYCWVNDASVQVLDERGHPIGAIGSLQDITERKQVELALRESEATTRALLEAIPDAFFRFDAQGVFKEYIPSRDLAPLFSSSEFAGKPYATVLPPSMVEQLDLIFSQVLEHGEPCSYEYPLQLGAQMRYFESRLVKMAQGDVLSMVRDVTDRKQAELALQRREAYLRSILDNFPYLVWLKDASGHFLAVNKVFAQACGQPSVEAVIGKTDVDVWPADLAEHYQEDDRQVMAGRQQQSVEEIINEQGHEIWFETFKSPIFDAQGQVIGTTGFAHDITARRQAEAAIRESEALFRKLADNAPALMAMSDERGTVTYLNRAWREFRGEVPALPLAEWSQQIHPADRERYLHEFRSTLQLHRKITIEYRLRRADGQYRWLLDTVVPRYAADERYAGLIGIAIDITDRKNAEEALRRSESRLRLLTENMVDTICQVDALYRVLYVSPSIERVLGYRPSDLLNQRLLELLHPDDARVFYHQMIMATSLHAPTLRLVYRQRHAAGNYLWIESELRLLYDSAGELTSVVLGSRDVSMRQQAELERETLIRELEEKNAELERFTYTVSHDLKSPLITIRGFLGFLEKDASSGQFERLHADVGRIAEATTRMQRLLDELLNLSRVGRLTNPPEVIPFDDMAREAVELVQGRIMARNVRVEIAPNLPAVYGDRARLIEVLQNLIDNAVKFMGDQPNPRIVIGALGSDRDGLPIFFVQDNGAGIDPAYHERIFGLFNKLDAQTEGTGVGLALVKRIIEVHGGHIWVESDGSGRGATFLFTLPRRPTSTRAA